MRRIDLNADIGEGFGADLDLLRVVTSANVACGHHAGSPELARTTVERCVKAGVRVGAHPGYPDRATMGRRSATEADRAGFRDDVLRQLRAFLEFAPVAYLKPHGALYNDSCSPGWEADLVAEALVLLPSPMLMGLAGTFHEHIAALAGVPFESEGFADRGYGEDGRLLPRGREGAFLREPRLAAAQAVKIASHVETICIHGDAPDCVVRAAAVREALERAGYRVAAP